MNVWIITLILFNFFFISNFSLPRFKNLNVILQKKCLKSVKDNSLLPINQYINNNIDKLSFNELILNIPPIELLEYKEKNLLFNKVFTISNETPKIGRFAVANPKGFLQKPNIAKLYGFDIENYKNSTLLLLFYNNYY